MARTKYPKKIEIIQISSSVFAISRSDLAKYLKITNQAIIRYEKQTPPLRRIDLSEIEVPLDPKKVWYDHIYALRWHAANVSVINSAMGGMSATKGDDIDLESPITQANAKEVQMLEEARIKREERKKKVLENEILKRKYVPVEKADKLATSLAVLLISALQNLKEILPQRIIGLKTVDEARDILDDEFEATIKTLNDEVNK